MLSDVPLHRSAMGRPLIAVVSALALLCGGLIAGALPAKADDASLSVLSARQYGPDSSGYYDIVGEVQNIGSAPVGPARIDVSFFNAANELVATDFTYARVDRVAAGEKSPFSLSFQPVAGYDHFTVRASDGGYGALNHNFDVVVTNRYDDGWFEHVVGTVTNRNTTTSSFVEVVGTAYAADNAVVDAGTTFINNSSKELAPGTSATFDLVFYSRRAFDRYVLVPQSITASSTPAAPAPSPSSPAPSSPAPSSPAPSSSAPSSPAPSASPDVAPTVRLVQTVISAGERVTVLYDGAPGQTLDILSRTQPSTVFTKIGQVVLDDSGSATSTHAPQKNTRITARTTGGTASAQQPIIAVRSVGSMTPKRVGPRTYTFSGRIYPARDQRLVSLYRNDVLVAQGRTSASGIYSITKTLAAGTYTFQARTSDDTYNLGTRAPARRFLVF